MARPIHRRYLSPEWEHERRAQNLTEDEVVHRTRTRFEAAAARGLSKVVIQRHALDDPFTSDNVFEAQLWMATRKDRRKR